MSHTPHQLADEFPNEGDLLHRLKTTDTHFAMLVDRYNDVNHAIHRIEAGIEPASDEHTETLKKQRLSLLDEIGAIVAAERGAVA